MKTLIAILAITVVPIIITILVSDYHSKQCDKGIHKYINYNVVLRMRPKHYGDILEDYNATMEICRHCGDKKEPDNLEYKQGFQSVSMPSSRWDELKENGYLIISKLED